MAFLVECATIKMQQKEEDIQILKENLGELNHDVPHCAWQLSHSCIALLRIHYINYISTWSLYEILAERHTN